MTDATLALFSAEFSSEAWAATWEACAVIRVDFSLSNFSNCCKAARSCSSAFA